MVLKLYRVNPPANIIMHKRINPRVTSYEIVCATARSAPIKAYFELDDHPDPRIVYTVRLDKARIKRIPRFKSASEKGIGSGAQIDMAKAKAIVGAIRNIVWEDVEGRTGSLINSFTLSAIG